MLQQPPDEAHDDGSAPQPADSHARSPTISSDISVGDISLTDDEADVAAFIAGRAKPKPSSVQELADFLARTGPEDFRPAARAPRKDDPVYKRMWKEWKKSKKAKQQQQQQQQQQPGAQGAGSTRKFVMLPVRYDAMVAATTAAAPPPPLTQSQSADHVATAPLYPASIPSSSGASVASAPADTPSQHLQRTPSLVSASASMRKLEDLVRTSHNMDRYSLASSSGASNSQHAGSARASWGSSTHEALITNQPQGEDALATIQERSENDGSANATFTTTSSSPNAPNPEHMPNRISARLVPSSISIGSSTGNAPSLIRTLIQTPTSAISPTRSSFELDNKSPVRDSGNPNITNLSPHGIPRSHLSMSTSAGGGSSSAPSSAASVMTHTAPGSPQSHRKKVRHVQTQTGSRTQATRDAQTDLPTSKSESSNAAEAGAGEDAIDPNLVAVLQSQNSSLQSNVSNLNSEVTNLQAENAALHAKTQRLEAELSATRAALNAAEAQSSNVRGQLANTRDQLSTATARADAHATEVATHRAHAEYLEKQCTTLATHVQQLEATVVHERAQHAAQAEEFERLSRAAYAKMKQLILERIDLVNEIDVWRAKLRDANARAAERQVEEVLGYAPRGGANASTTSLAHSLLQSVSAVPQASGSSTGSVASGEPPGNTTLHGSPITLSVTPPGTFTGGMSTAAPSPAANSSSYLSAMSALAAGVGPTPAMTSPPTNHGKKRVQFQDPNASAQEMLAGAVGYNPAS